MELARMKLLHSLGHFFKDKNALVTYGEVAEIAISDGLHMLKMKMNVRLIFITLAVIIAGLIPSTLRRLTGSVVRHNRCWVT